MDISETEESKFSATHAKFHSGMCKILSSIYCRVAGIFPVLEEARPRSNSGIQALCSLHLALEKAKNLLHYCSESSKLYLAITGDSVVLKFDRARSALVDSLSRVEDIVPKAISCQILEILVELEGATFSLDPSEKQVGDQIISLLQQGRHFESDCVENYELETFHQAVVKLGIMSPKGALTERRSLKKHIEKARVEEDKRKESIVAYLLHLMKKYSKLFRTDFSDNDLQGSDPCSPAAKESVENGDGYERHFVKLSSFNFNPCIRRSQSLALPPEELRCPISLQIMYDPVIISSGQTYERLCIEKWFSDGHNTCPKTQQKLTHLCVTPNYCVKGLIASWSEQNGLPLPDTPPESLDFNYWRLDLSETESMSSKSLECVGAAKLNGAKVVVALDESGVTNSKEEGDLKIYEDFFYVLGEEDMKKKSRVVEDLRRLLKDDGEARIFMGAHGFVEALVKFLESALHERNETAQEIGAMALFNLAVNNNRNKEAMIGSGVLSLLGEMISQSSSHPPIIALYLNLSCLDEAKPLIAGSHALPFLVNSLLPQHDPQSRLDALHALFNLSSHPPNVPTLLHSGLIVTLVDLLTSRTWPEKSLAVLINLASYGPGKREMGQCLSLITGLASALEMGSSVEQEHSTACLLLICEGEGDCMEMVLREGVVPSLVSISVNGTSRGKDKAQRLLKLFRDHRQGDQREPERRHMADNAVVKRPTRKASSKRRLGRVDRALSYLRKGNKNLQSY